MAAREKIEIDFGRALQQADKIDSVADRLSNLSGNEFQGNLDSLSANWRGDSASMYIAKGGRLQEQINGTAKDLHTVAADIRTIAKRMYTAEITAWKIATTRDY